MSIACSGCRGAAWCVLARIIRAWAKNNLDSTATNRESNERCSAGFMAISPVPLENYGDSANFCRVLAWTCTVSTVKTGRYHLRKISQAIQPCAGKRHHRRAVPIACATRGQARPILYMQTFDDLVTFDPHIHALVADGIFLPSGTFRLLPPLPETALCEALRHKVRWRLPTTILSLRWVGVSGPEDSRYLQNRCRESSADGLDVIGAAVGLLPDPCGVIGLSAVAAGDRALEPLHSRHHSFKFVKLPSSLRH